MALEPLRDISCLSKTWLEKMLSKYHTDASVSVANYEINIPNSVSQGYLSEISYVTVRYTINGQEVLIKLVLKFLPSSEDVVSTMESCNLVEREVSFYSLMKVGMFSSFLENTHIIPDPIFVAHEKRALTIVMKDMSEFGYNLNVVKEGTDLAETKMTLNAIAKIHAIGYLYQQKHGKLPMKPLIDSGLIEEYLKTGLNILIERITDTKYNELLRKCQKYTSQMTRSASATPFIFETIIHGDLWAGQILYSSETQTACILDWQFSAVGDPMCDIQTMFSVSVKPECVEDNLDDLLSTYYKSFKEALGSEPSPVTLHDIKQHLEELWMHGFYFLIAGVRDLIQGDVITNERLIRYFDLLDRRNVFTSFFEKLKS